MEYTRISILDMVEEIGEDRCKNILSFFSCPLNRDVEDFIRNRALAFAQQKVAITFLVFAQNDGKQELVGYFTLANKFVAIMEDSKLSNSLQKRILKFSQYDDDLNRYLLSMPLIAQLGKNFDKTIKTYISGNVLLDMACAKVMEAQNIIGGKTVYIECGDNPKLYDFYGQNGFYEFGKREKESEELLEGNYFVQMLKYFKKVNQIGND